MRTRTLMPLILFTAFVLALGGYGWWVSGLWRRTTGMGWQGFASAWPFLLAGGVTVAVVIAGFVRLAVVSHKRGYDDRAGIPEP